MAACGTPPRFDREQLGGDIAHLAGRAPFRAFPLLAPKPMPGGLLRACAEITTDPVELSDWDVKHVATEILDGEEVAGRAADIEPSEAAIAAYPMVGVNYRRARGEFG